MAPPKIRPKLQERAFKPSELFFSTTDKRGVIRYGNEVFCRIAAYPLAEMVGKPHNIIRHPDMPRAAFRLVWDYLERGRTVAAYVKNMASDGCYYWVLALIMPAEDGYLSIRMKPSSEVFSAVQGAYVQVLAAEQQAEAGGASRGEAMDAGAAKLLALLGGLGFASYDEFMWAALSAEMVSRGAILAGNESDMPGLGDLAGQGAHDDGTPRGRLIALFAKSRDLDRQLGDMFTKPGTFSQLRDQIIPKTVFISELGSDIRIQSTNAEVQAAKLGDSGRALAMVAERLGKHASEGVVMTEHLNEHMRNLTSPISELIFNSMVSKVQIEMASDFVREILEGSPEKQGESGACHDELAVNLRLLFRAFLGTARQTPVALGELQSELDRVDKQAYELRRFMRTLRFIHLAGRIETSRYTNTQLFEAIFDEIRETIAKTGKVLSDLLEQIDANKKQIASMDNVDAHVFNQFDSLIAA